MLSKTTEKVHDDDFFGRFSGTSKVTPSLVSRW
jgi:hypothetical protein